LPTSQRVFLRHKDGRRIAVEVHVMPLRNDEGEILGGVEIFRDASSFVALETAYDRLREFAEKDPLTGAANRHSLDELLESQLQLLQRTGIPFSIIMADLDHFKQINDTWGHAVGDKTLIAFTKQLQACCRKTDVVGRLGGDEFIVILPEVRLPDATTAAERMLRTVTQSTKSSMAPSPTASLGVTEALLDDTPASLLERVDSALYQAKHKGRNRIELA
jgi:diguanylate cyclase (GGDEF)-like protein